MCLGFAITPTSLNEHTGKWGIRRVPAEKELELLSQDFLPACLAFLFLLTVTWLSLLPRSQGQNIAFNNCKFVINASATRATE